ncbi:AfsR/SARP family transcriptional regulator [Amycolatopsis sp. NPDC021455]|uniref:AfsR/SARP family transcriptional regulator n=1 Tax=Amycolatopsis sp. NPDC021455 TaxID=3154901 RepID=UPI0034105BBE
MAIAHGVATDREIEFRLLGPLEVRARGRRLAVGGPRQRAVLAALLLRADRVATVDYLARAVWGRPPASMRANLRTYVAALRRVLGDPGDGRRIVTQPDGYRLLVRRDECDVARFEYWRVSGDRAARTGDTERAAQCYDHALSVWRGGLLDGLPAVGPALRAEADRWEERRLAVLERSVEVRLLLGAHEDVFDVLYGVVAEHPLRERFWGQLMRGLYASGRRAEALDTYRRARRFLVSELGVEPGEDLQGIQQMILDGTLIGDAC